MEKSRDSNNEFPMCFACGRDNPAGLHLAFTVTEEGSCCHFSLPGHFQGYENIIHGGLVSTVMDEAMAWAILAKVEKAFTVKMEITFKKPLAPNVTYCVNGCLDAVHGRRLTASARITNLDGEVLAQAQALFLNANK